MAQHGFNQMGGSGSIDPSDLSMGGNYNQGFQNYNSNQHNGSSGFSSGSALLQDDDLLDGLGSPTEQQGGLQGGGQDFGGMNDMSMGGYASGIYAQHGLPLEQSHVNGFSNTPEGDPIQSPYVQGLRQYRQMHHPQAFGSIQSPGSYTGSPLASSEFNNESADPNFLKARNRMSQTMQRKVSSTRSPLNTKNVITGMHVGSSESFGAQPIRTNSSSHEKSAGWIQTPNSLSSFPGSGFSSPIQHGLQGAQLNELLMKAGTSMPAKLGGAPMTSSQEAKRKRRRESHNLVERRRRDNINERIQDLSKLVPLHRLEDEKIKKLISSGTPLSPTLTGVSNPAQATSTLAGPGARRATSGTAGNITTGLPIEEKDKGPNKGDILNGAVSWTRDLMWLLDMHISRQEELIELFNDRGEALPFTITDDERRMTSELINAMREAVGAESDKRPFSYTRTAGSGLRVPDHTDYKGDALNGSGHAEGVSVSPDDGSGVMVNDLVHNDHYWDDDDGSGELDLKEEDEFMDLN